MFTPRLIFLLSDFQSHFLHPMTSFVDRIAQSIREKGLSFQHLTIVVPSERMIGALQRALYSIDKQPKLSPKMVTIDRWIHQTVREPIVDKTRLLFELYVIFLENPAEINETSFDTFLNWGQLLLNDFDEIDRYLVDPKQLFKNLRDVREIEQWSFNSDELSSAQLKFMAFWDKLGDYYEAVTKKLTANQHLTKGKAYRKLAENCDLAFAEDSQMHFVFAGFNALSIAELSIMKQLFVMGRAEIYMDSDSYYLNDNFHEAGTFQRVLLESLGVKTLPFVNESLATKVCDFNLIECAQTTGQAKVIGTLLAQLSTEQLSETLVLLADEQLIVSLIQHLPASIGKANITLGLPLKTTSLRLWVDLLFRIQESFLRRKNTATYYKEVIQYFHHPFIQGIATAEEQTAIRNLEQTIIEKNRHFLSLNTIAFSERLTVLNRLVLTPWEGNWQQAIATVQLLNQHLDEVLTTKNTFEKAIIRSFSHALIGFDSILDNKAPTMQLSTFKLLFNQHWGTERLAYFGNPTDGLQIMGLLETRGLDFKRIFVMGLNEGTMPPTNPIQTLIPMDLRRYFQLPTPREKQGLFAHHFYRLLHSAEEVHVTYASSDSAMGTGEPSRFIQQLELELGQTNPNFTIKKHSYTLGNEENVSKIEIHKTPEIIARLDELMLEGLTFSKLKSFLNCPLNFYHRYVLRLGEENQVEDEIESGTMGTVLHSVLENSFQPYNRGIVENQAAGKLVTLDDLKQMQDASPLLVAEAFKEHFSDDVSIYDTGTNHINFEMAKKITHQYFAKEIAEKEKRSESTLVIEGLEQKMSVPMELTVQENKKTILLEGVIDRIELRDGKIKVIDFKSGVVDSAKTKLPTLTKNESLSQEEKIINSLIKKSDGHQLQLLIYAYLYQKSKGVYIDSAGIFSLVSMKDSPFELQLPDDFSMAQATDLVEEIIAGILEKVYDVRETFAHTTNAKYCQYCG